MRGAQYATNAEQLGSRPAFFDLVTVTDKNVFAAGFPAEKWPKITMGGINSK